jgi:hypothetical protein
MTRQKALIELEDNSYIDSPEGKLDKLYVLRKLGISEEEFSIYLQSPAVPHNAYGSEEWLLNALIKLNNAYKKIK